MRVGLRNVAFLSTGHTARSAETLNTVATGLTAWYDSSQLSGLNDGDALSSWADATGNGHTVSQASAPAKPIYKTNIVNGHPIVRFTGTSSQGMAGSDSGFPTGDITTILVVKLTLDLNDGVYTYPFGWERAVYSEEKSSAISPG